MRGRRLAIPLIVIGSVAVGGVAGAVLGVPSLSGAANTGATVSATSVPGANAHAKGAIGDRFEAAAKALHLTPEQLKDKLSDGKTTIADVAKAQNVDIDDVIDAIAAADRKAIEDWVNKPLPHRPFAKGPSAGTPGAPKGNGGAAKPGMRGGAFGAGAFRGLDDIAKSLKTTPKELIQDLMSGKSIAQIAKDKGVDVNKLIDDAVAAATKRIDEAQSNGKLSKEQADKAKSTVRDAITNLVNGELPNFGGKGGFHLPKLGGGQANP